MKTSKEKNEEEKTRKRKELICILAFRDDKTYAVGDEYTGPNAERLLKKRYIRGD